MQEISKKETSAAPVLKEHDYIGLSSKSSSPSTSLVMNSYFADSSQRVLDETDLRLDLGLGLGLGSRSAKIKGEVGAKISFPLRQLPTPSGLCSSASKNGMKRRYSETKVTTAGPGLGNVEGDVRIVRQQGAFLPIWATSKPTLPAWQNEKQDPPSGLTERIEPQFSAERKQDLVEDDAPPAKGQVVGWPPVRAYRRQTLSKPPEMYVKVNMEGITVGRKVDLNAYTSYESLLLALQDMFQPSSNAQGPYSSARDQDAKHFLLSKGSDFVLTYEDKEGDWMLVGDVPWSMFVSTVIRLRIARGEDATGSGREKPRFHA